MVVRRVTGRGGGFVFEPARIHLLVPACFNRGPRATRRRFAVSGPFTLWSQQSTRPSPTWCICMERTRECSTTL